MTREESIVRAITDALSPEHLLVENESQMHNVPAGSESHFKVIVVSSAFEGLSSIERHRRVNDALAAEFEGGLHALTMRTLTPAQWIASEGTRPSPACMGGEKKH